jgi:hypothetical protein
MNEKKENVKNAIEAILPIVSNLSLSQWERLYSLIKMYYTNKAAKTMLDGNDVEKLKKMLHEELLRF